MCNLNCRVGLKPVSTQYKKKLSIRDRDKRWICLLYFLLLVLLVLALPGLFVLPTVAVMACHYFLSVLEIPTGPPKPMKTRVIRWRHRIRNRTVLWKVLGISDVLNTFPDSRHVQLAIHTVVHAESESAVGVDRFLHPAEKIRKTQCTRVSISHCNIYYVMWPSSAKQLQQTNVYRDPWEWLVGRDIARRCNL